MNKAKLLKIYVGEATKHDGKNVVQLIIKILKENEIAGATVSRGIMGYGSDGIIHGTKLVELSSDLPIIIDVVDSEENIQKVLPKILEVLPKGLCFTLDVDVHFYGTKTK
ncbi:DUF190 domain-containing protein [Carboxydothermus pertinax]|uniref:Uncharacterized protein n=1 Tax=Carboxydothermus pertinax TaxID=870242 RepID=A0A1L8CWI3_9THEO|nr:DUF190 domain-containing protein [Carboxydothermus pertinax]GAV23278.1 hypothetical protein cpu_17880 [Carboxydothermus pertinax]